MPEELVAYLRTRTPELIDELGRWIEIESFSSDVTAVSWMVNVVGERLQALGQKARSVQPRPQGARNGGPKEALAEGLLPGDHPRWASRQRAPD